MNSQRNSSVLHPMVAVSTTHRSSMLLGAGPLSISCAHTNSTAPSPRRRTTSPTSNLFAMVAFAACAGLWVLTHLPTMLVQLWSSLSSLFRSSEPTTPKGSSMRFGSSPTSRLRELLLAPTISSALSTCRLPLARLRISTPSFLALCPPTSPSSSTSTRKDEPCEVQIQNSCAPCAVNTAWANSNGGRGVEQGSNEPSPQNVKSNGTRSQSKKGSRKRGSTRKPYQFSLNLGLAETGARQLDFCSPDHVVRGRGKRVKNVGVMPATDGS